MALCAQIPEGLVQLTICGDSLEIFHPDREILLVACCWISCHVTTFYTKSKETCKSHE